MFDATDEIGVALAALVIAAASTAALGQEDCRQHYDPATGKVYYGCGPTKKAPAQPTAPSMGVEHEVMCQSKETVERLRELSSDALAFGRYLAEAVMIGECMPFIIDDKHHYFIEGTPLFGGMRVRPEGSTISYWVCGCPVAAFRE